MGTPPRGTVEVAADTALHMQGPKDTPARLLADNVVLTPTQLAAVVGLTYTQGRNKGKPDPQRARDLIRSGAIRAVDPDVDPGRWTVTCIEARRYADEGPRKVAAPIPRKVAS